MWTADRPIRRAFTIMEMVAVITISVLIAGAVLPAVSRIDDARRLAARSEIERQLEFTRAHAAASGTPAGLRFDTDAETSRSMELDASGVVRVMTDALGNAAAPTFFAADYGADIRRVSFQITPTSVSLDAGTIWFDHHAAPHLRNTDGTRAGDLATDGLVEIGDAGAVVIRAVSGLTETQP